MAHLTSTALLAGCLFTGPAWAAVCLENSDRNNRPFELDCSIVFAARTAFEGLIEPRPEIQELPGYSVVHKDRRSTTTQVFLVSLRDTAAVDATLSDETAFSRLSERFEAALRADLCQADTEFSERLKREVITLNFGLVPGELKTGETYRDPVREISVTFDTCEAN